MLPYCGTQGLGCQTERVALVDGAAALPVSSGSVPNREAESKKATVRVERSLGSVVEDRGLEPLTSALPALRSPS